MTDINPAAKAAQDAARQGNGTFGTQEHTAPEVGLDRPQATPESSVEDLLTVIASNKTEADRLRAEAAEADAAREKAEEQLIGALAAELDPRIARVVLNAGHPKYPVEFFDDEDAWLDFGKHAEEQFISKVTDLIGDSPDAVGGRGTARLVDIRPIG